MDERRKTGEWAPLDNHAGADSAAARPAEDAAPSAVPPPDDRSGERQERERDRGLGDFVRRAVSAGVEVASRSKDDIMRAAAGEVRTWLDHLDVNNELLKTLSRMVIEVKTEIRFRPTDDGKFTSDTTNDVKVKPKG